MPQPPGRRSPPRHSVKAKTPVGRWHDRARIDRAEALTSWFGLLDMASMTTFRNLTICAFAHFGQVCITFHGPVLSDHLQAIQTTDYYKK